ncbi:MAG: hypothetical protein HY782_04375 [Chloroflexi bacterium]|nr:hypothetical protein [Chloroflexota bacterium]
MNQKRWIPFPSTVDPTRHTVSALTTHFTTFGITQAQGVQPYLPALEGFQTSLFTGAATSELSFEMPPGRGQLVPKLSLGYSSTNVDMLTDDQQSSYVGVGWALSASYIARDTRASYAETDDVFVIVLNGASYDLAKGTDGFYHTELEQFWRISWDTTNNRWLVKTNDGTQYQYGYSANSRAVQYRTNGPGTVIAETYTWWLEKVIDVHTNEIGYTYQHETEQVTCEGQPVTNDNAVYPQYLRYNGTAQSGYLTEVRFLYSARPDYRFVLDQYQCGGDAPYGTQRLDQVQVWTTASGMQHVRRYAFTYDYSTFPTWTNYAGQVTGRLTLKQITRFGKDQTSALPPYSFSYTNDRLSQSANGIGGTVSFTYDSIPLSGRTYYRVISKTVSDGVSAASVYGYTYTGAAVNDAAHSVAAQTANPRHPLGTQFRGHSQVVVTDPLGNKTQNDFYQDDVFRGHASQIIQAGTSITTKYTRTANTYGQTVIPIDASATTTTGNYSNFVFLGTTQRETWDTQPTPRTVKTYFSYDAYGNLTQTDEWGEYSSSYRKTLNTFYPNTTAWILNKVGLTQVFDTFSARVSETRYLYDGATSHTTAPTKGDLTRVDVTDDGTTYFSSLRNTYDSYGNALTTKDGVGNTTTFAYDSVYHLFPTTVTNALNQVTTNGYDTRMGKLLSTTDPNNATTSYDYDVFGRLETMRAPFEQGQSPTMRYVYTLGSPRSSVEVRERRDAGGANPTDNHHTWYFYDGLGRVIQRQDDRLGGNMIIVNTEYDLRSQVKRVSNPYFVASSGGTYLTPDWNQPVTQHDYDPIGRETKQTNPDGTKRFWQYLLWTTTTYATNASDETLRLNETKTQTDAFGRTNLVQQFNQGQIYAHTSYDSDVLDRLWRIQADSNTTITVYYDWLGHKPRLTDPDLGEWNYNYDRNGNLKSQRDARQQKTCLYYDGLNRRLGKVYVTTGSPCPDNPTSYAVSFTYDQGTNGKGHRTGMSDASGTTSWAYDPQGRNTSQTKTFTGQPALVTSWTYDAMNRPLTMTYPDGETIAMTYSRQNQIATRPASSRVHRTMRRTNSPRSTWATERRPPTRTIRKTCGSRTSRHQATFRT